MVDLTDLEKQEEKLKYLDKLILKEYNSFVEYNVENGTSIGFGLFKNPNIAVQRAFLTEASIFPKHQHAEQEYIIVYQGKIKVHCDDVCAIKNKETTKESNDIILEVGDSIYFKPHNKHEIEVLEDSWVIGITIPPTDGYPDA